MPKLRSNPKHIGDAAEDMVSMFHGLAENQKRAVFWKIPTPTRWVDGKLIYAEKSIVDFLGVLCADGRHIAEEVKHCAGPSFDLAQVKPHQRLYLDKVVAARGLAVVTVVGARNDVHVVPWAAVRGKSRVSMEELAPWSTKISDYFSPAFVQSFLPRSLLLSGLGQELGGPREVFRVDESLGGDLGINLRVRQPSLLGLGEDSVQDEDAQGRLAPHGQTLAGRHLDGESGHDVELLVGGVEADHSD